MKKRVSASAPGKLMLFGEHAVIYGDPCIVTTVDQRIRAEVERNGEDVFHLEAPDLGLEVYKKSIEDLGSEEMPKEVRFIERLYKNFLDKYPQDKGIIVETKSEFSSSFGFGSSSAVTVGFAKALVELYGLEFSKGELFDLCYGAVLDVQGVGSGFDLAAAIWGGTLYYVSPAKVVEKLEVGKLPLVVGYTGVKADTPTLVRMVRRLKEERQEMVEGVFGGIAEVVEEAGEVIEKGDWERAGGLMDKNQELLRKLQVSSVELEDLIEASEKAGALGAKLSGAGGGDCMIAVVEEKKRGEVEKEMDKVGGRALEVEAGVEGVRVEEAK